MALKRCRISRLVLNTVRLGLLVAWLVLTGTKVSHFLSEPTALQSRVDSDFQLPYISVFREESGFPNYMHWVLGSFRDNFTRIMELRNQTLLEFVRSHSMSLAELSGETDMLNDEQRKHRFNETTIENSRGNWSVTLTALLNMGATLTPNNAPVVLGLPRYTDFIAAEELRDVSKTYYRLVFHGTPCLFAIQERIDTSVFLGNTTFIPQIRLNIDRLKKLNLRREPCEEDSAYDVSACIRKCLFNRINCSLYGNETGGGKPTCMFYDLGTYLDYSFSFIADGNIRAADRCGCPQPCIQDSISYNHLSENLISTVSRLGIRIYVSRVRQTKVMVLTYGLEDLLADMGGYLGLLLGASLLSVYGTGRKLIRHLVRQVKHRRQQAANEEEQNDTETAWTYNRVDAASDVNNFVPLQLVHTDFLRRFVQSPVLTESEDVDKNLLTAELELP